MPTHPVAVYHAHTVPIGYLTHTRATLDDKDTSRANYELITFMTFANHIFVHCFVSTCMRILLVQYQRLNLLLSLYNGS
jgi:hypothetical protein